MDFDNNSCLSLGQYNNRFIFGVDNIQTHNECSLSSI